MNCRTSCKQRILRSIVVFLLFVFPSLIHAADFVSDYDTQYAVSPSGTTIVTQNITLTNKQSNVYPKLYTVTIDSEKIHNVIAYDAKGVITPKITKQDGKTNISVPFNEQIVGIDKKLSFSLRYENGNIAQLLGNVWEIRIPGVINDPTIGEYTVSLQVPSTFPANAYMTPLPGSGQRWTKQQLLNGGINAAYGEYQSYVVDILYTIENDSLSNGFTTVTIPGDTQYQSVSINSITPQPKEMKKDEDGNWLATYELAPKEKQDVVVQQLIQTYNKPKISNVPVEINKEIYLKQDRYWETQDAKIQALAKQYTTPRAIYNYVVNTLSYDYEATNQQPIRKGALSALNAPSSSVCTEFTDLFIAIARAAGIPSREIVGYAYTTDAKLRPLLTGADILHAWPEYWDADRKTWIAIDPTWGFTTGGVNYFDVFDFNHIAFVIHGTSSETPYPAGSYKQGSIPRKNISVKFASVKKMISTDNFRTSFLFPEKASAGKSLQGTIQIENTGSTLVQKVDIQVTSLPFSYAYTKTENDVPPFGIISIPVKIPIQDYFARGTGKLLVSVNGKQNEYTYRVEPMYWLLAPIGTIAICLISLIWILLKKR